MMRLLLPLVLLMMAACSGVYSGGDGDDNTFSAFATVDSKGWPYSEPFEFEPDTLRDSVATGRLLVSVRHGKNYGEVAGCRFPQDALYAGDMAKAGQVGDFGRGC